LLVLGCLQEQRKNDWLSLAGQNANLKYALALLYDQFKEAPTLGSLINPEVSLGKGTLGEIKLSEISPVIARALFEENDDLKDEMGVVAKGIARAAQLLSDNYCLIITNVPYLTRGKQNDILQGYSENYFPEGKYDLATVFLDRCLQFCQANGTCSLVMPQNWLFLKSYEKFRQKLLKDDTWHLIAWLGPGAFETISGEVVKAILMVISKGNTGRDKSSKAPSLFSSLDVSDNRLSSQKALQLIDTSIVRMEQARQLDNPGTKISSEQLEIESVLGDFALVHHGSKPGQTVRVTRQFWEVADIRDKFWMTLESSPSMGELFSGKSEICFSLETIKKFEVTAFGVRGSDAWGKKGIILSKMSDLPFAIYLGGFFDNNTCVITPKQQADYTAILCSMMEGKFLEAVRSINKKVSVEKETLESTPFNMAYWRTAASSKYPNGVPKPYTKDPTQWVFHGHPAQSDTPLQVGVARMLGYRWPAELDYSMELSDESHFWIKKSEALLPYADKDGIVCIPSVRGESRAVDRLENLLAVAYGSEWSVSKKSELLTQVGYAGKSLESWLREKFFAQHCSIFRERPFIWHIWDGLNDGFGALINYHKLDRRLLETLIYTYLGDWINRQIQDKASGVDGAEEKLAAADALRKRLELVLEGESPYDIFVRWKPIEEQPIGWNPDFNDGIRLNIRPFLSVPEIGKKGAGVLRDRPNVNWENDRGKDAPSSPWFNLGPKLGGYEGDRINSHHLSLSEKRKAREH
jgi:hypothetical protein